MGTYIELFIQASLSALTLYVVGLSPCILLMLIAKHREHYLSSVVSFGELVDY